MIDRIKYANKVNNQYFCHHNEKNYVIGYIGNNIMI